MLEQKIDLNAINQGFVVAIRIDAKPGEEAAVAALLEGLVAPTMAEAGVKIFLPYRSPKNPACFFVFELYHDAEGWQQHQQTEHFKQSIAQLLPKISRRERVPFMPYVSALVSSV